MNTLAFSLIVTSAVMHALWNLLVKRSRHKTVFIWWMFVASSTLYTLVLPMVPGGYVNPDLFTIAMVVIGATCFVLYHLFTGRAYRGGDLSMVYPLCQTSMIYVPVWGVTFLGERLTTPGLAGIALVIFGTYSLQLQQMKFSEMIRPFRNLKDRPVQNALMAGFIYSIGSIAEKCGVRHCPPLFFTYMLVLSMLVLMSINIMRSKYRPLIRQELQENWRLILASGPIMMASFLTFRYGLNLSPVSYAVPVRQVSIVVGVLIGTFFLGERFGRIRIVSALLILAGAALIWLG